MSEVDFIALSLGSVSRMVISCVINGVVRQSSAANSLSDVYSSVAELALPPLHRGTQTR